MNANQYYERIKMIFEEHSNEQDARAMKAYMRNQFEFYGIRSPQRRALQKMIFSDIGKSTIDDLQTVVQHCWDNDYREMQYFAMDLMDKYLRKLDATFLSFLEKLILQKSWWDTVDWLAPNGIGQILLRQPELTESLTTRWIEADNIWLQRSAILFQLKYKDKTDVSLMRQHILFRADSKEFFVQKAAGWMLREHSKRNADWVIDFVNQNELAPLTKREALKWLERKGLL